MTRKDTLRLAARVNGMATLPALLLAVFTEASVMGQQGPVLSSQANQAINELATLVVTNTAVETNTQGRQFAGVTVAKTQNFAYANRDALLADGWSFIATTPTNINGVPTTYLRNTETTNGLLVDYDQNAHPGYINIPCDQGDLWGNQNTSRNFLSRALPPNWTRINLALTFNNLSLDFQQTHMALYQDDDNYVQVGAAHNDTTQSSHDPTNSAANGFNIETVIWEYGGGDNHHVHAYNLPPAIELRMDRDPVSGYVQCWWSTDGVHFGDIADPFIPQLTNYRLGIWTGGSPAGAAGAATLVLRGLEVDTYNPTIVLSYALLSAPAGASIDANGVITWTPAEGQGASTNVFTAVVTDNGLPPLSATNSFTVVVSEVNFPPSLPAQPDRIVNVPNTFIVTNRATDPDIPVEQMSYQLAVAPPGATIGGDGVISWTPSAGQQFTTNLFITVVTDFNPQAVNAQSLSATNSFNVVVLPPPWPILPTQPDYSIYASTTLAVTNTATDGAPTVSQIATNTILFNYTNSAALFADGWSYVGTNYLGGPRNTETTAGAGVADYSQTAHPGALRIPCDQGDLWGTGASVNNTRNSLFRSLPANWLSVRLALTFGPVNANYLQAHLGLYQDDNNYLQIGAAFNGSEGLTMDRELAGSPVPFARVPTTQANLYFRLDRNPTNSLVTGFYSFDGLAWTVLGATNLTLTNPRLMIWTGGSQTAYANGMPVMDVRRLDVVAPTNVPTVLTYSLLNAPPEATIDVNGIITWQPGPTNFPGPVLFATIVTDNGVPPLTATNSFRVTVNTVRNGPALPPQTDLTVAQYSTLWVTNTAADNDLPFPGVTYTLHGAPLGAAIDTNGIISWTPGPGQGHTTNTLTTVVSDNAVPPLSATNSFTVVVNEMNVPPVLPVQADRSLAGRQTLTVNNAASEPDMPPTTLSYQLSGPAGSGIDANGLITWTPSVAQVPSTNTFATIVTDSNPWAVNAQSLSATNSFVVVVLATHNGPMLPAQPSFTVAQYSPLTVTNAASDSDLPALGLAYSLANPPAGAAIDTNGVISWTPGPGQGHSTNTITTVVTDTGIPPLSATNNVAVVVNEMNVPPVLPVQADRFLAGRQPLTVNNAASEPDMPPTTLTYQLTGPDGSAIDANGLITWIPSVAQVPSTNTFTTLVTDFNPWAFNAQSLSATNSFVVVVLATHNGPLLPAQPSFTVAQYSTLTVTNTASDSDLPAFGLTYSLASAPAGAAVDANGVISWTPGAGQGHSTNTITTVVSDAAVPPLSATNSFTVVVNEMNVPPVLPVQADRSLAGRQSLAVNNAASEPDMPPATLSYQLSGPAGSAIDADGLITWRPSVAQVPSTNTFTTVVTAFNPWAVNAQSLSTTNSFVVVAALAHNGPFLPVQTNLTIDELTTLIVTNTASSLDVPVLALSYSLVNPSAGAAIDTNGVISWTPGPGQGHSTNTIATVVTDAGTPPLSATNSFSVVVNEINTPPGLPAQADRVLTGMQTLIVTNTATDLDLPANDLSYSFLSAPAGVILGAEGVITWTPTAAQVPGLYHFQVVVSDYSPWAVNAQHLSATNSFSVQVNAIHNGPQLPAQPNVTIGALKTMIVTNSAIDCDVPVLGLNYALIYPPAGATIDTNGVITWTPATAQAPTNCTLTTLAWDNGSPPLSSVNSFTVTVTAPPTPPTLKVSSVSNGNVVFRWDSASNSSYRVQYKDRLDQTNWLDLVPDVLATGATTTFTNASGSAPTRFYRVLVLP